MSTSSIGATSGHLVNVPLLSRTAQQADRVYISADVQPIKARPAQATFSELNAPVIASAHGQGQSGSLVNVPTLQRPSQQADAVYASANFEPIKARPVNASLSQLNEPVRSSPSVGVSGTLVSVPQLSRETQQADAVYTPVIQARGDGSALPTAAKSIPPAVSAAA